MLDERELAPVIRAYELAVGEAAESQRSSQLQDLITAIEQFASDHPENADALHLLGLCWYHLPSGGVSELANAEAAFIRCLAIEPSHQYANLFLGHVLFDLHRYEEALDRSKRLDSKYFADRMQSWRCVKNKELMLCCRLMTEPTQTIADEVEAICMLYEAGPESDVPVPLELVTSLDTALARGILPPPGINRIARRVLSMLERTGNLEFKSLSDAVARLRKVADA